MAQETLYRHQQLAEELPVRRLPQPLPERAEKAPADPGEATKPAPAGSRGSDCAQQIGEKGGQPSPGPGGQPIAAQICGGTHVDVLQREEPPGGVNVQLNTNYGVNRLTRMPKFMDSWQYAIYQNETQERTGGAPLFSEEDIQKYKSGDVSNLYCLSSTFG